MWAAGIVSQLGSAVTDLAIPLIAVLLLRASALEMGALGASRTVAFLVVGLLAGVLVDRMSRRRVLIATSFGSAAVVASVPAAWLVGGLRIEQLYAVSFAAGCLMVVEGVAFQAFLPPLVGRSRLVEGNATLRASESVTGMAGPGLAGLLIQVLTAPIAIVVDALSFLVAGVLTLLVRVHEAEPPARAAGTKIRHEVAEGLRLIAGDPVLRAIALAGATHNIFSNGAIVALYVLFASQTLGLGPLELGLVFAAGGPGALAGSIVAGRYGRSAGMRTALTQSQLLTGIARLLIPLATLTSQPLLVLASGEFLLGIARSVFNVNQLSLRMAMTPDHLQGRMNASIRFLMWSVVPIGAIGGGLVADRVGIVPTMTVAGLGTVLAALWLLVMPETSDT